MPGDFDEQTKGPITPCGGGSRISQRGRQTKRGRQPIIWPKFAENGENWTRAMHVQYLFDYVDPPLP